MTDQISSNDSSNGSQLAMEHCTTGIAHFARFRADAMDHIDAAITADDNLALPHLVKGWLFQGGRDANYTGAVAKLISETEQRLPSNHSREHNLLAALKLAHAGLGIEAATTLEEMLHKSPTDLFVHTLIHEELFWMGRFDWMRDVTEQAAPAWRQTSEDYGPFLSLRSFAHEEAGHLEAAERFGRMAVEIDPSDIWGAHAVAHVQIMKGEIQSSIDWLEALSPNWNEANQMRHHMWWHICLFLLELGQHDRILELLTTHIRNPDSPLVQASPAASIDIQNVASLLLRLELRGVDVGEHWEVLSPICAGRVANHGNAFGNIHDMMVLTATGQFDAANELLSNMRTRYQGQSGSVALAYNAVSIPACEAVLAHRKKDYKRVLELLGGVRHDLSLMGASHAQRDLFYQLLVHAAEQESRSGLRAVFLRDIARIGFCGVTERVAYRQGV